MATHKVKLDVPTTNKGEPIEVPGLGVFENGATHTVDETQRYTWETLTGYKMPSTLKIPIEGDLELFGEGEFPEPPPAPEPVESENAEPTNPDPARENTATTPSSAEPVADDKKSGDK